MRGIAAEILFVHQVEIPEYAIIYKGDSQYHAPVAEQAHRAFVNRIQHINDNDRGRENADYLIDKIRRVIRQDKTAGSSDSTSGGYFLPPLVESEEQ